jgi:hypothetical protein
LSLLAIGPRVDLDRFERVSSPSFAFPGCNLRFLDGSLDEPATGIDIVVAGLRNDDVA